VRARACVRVCVRVSVCVCVSVLVYMGEEGGDGSVKGRAEMGDEWSGREGWREAQGDGSTWRYIFSTEYDLYSVLNTIYIQY